MADKISVFRVKSRSITISSQGVGLLNQQLFEVRGLTTKQSILFGCLVLQAASGLPFWISRHFFPCRALGSAPNIFLGFRVPEAIRSCIIVMSFSTIFSFRALGFFVSISFRV